MKFNENINKDGSMIYAFVAFNAHLSDRIIIECIDKK